MGMPDAAYDVIFRERVACAVGGSGQVGGTVANLAAGDLPLLLEDGGYSLGKAPPYGGQLSRGDLQDADLSQFTFRTQRDWSGGRGQRDSYAATDKYFQGVVDTRFDGYLLIPPFFGAMTGGGNGPSGCKDVIYSPELGALVAASQNNSLYSTTDGITWTLLVAVGAAVTGLAQFDKKLWIGLGDGVDMKSYDPVGLVLATVAGKRANCLWSDGSYLYIHTKATAVLDYYNGTAWNGAVNTHIPGQVNSMCSYHKELIIGGENGLWSMFSNITYLILGFKDSPDVRNAMAAVEWVDGKLYVTMASGVWAYDGTTFTRERVLNEDDGVSYPTAMCPTRNALLVGYTMQPYPAAKTGNVMARNLKGGWCQLNTGLGQDVLAMGNLKGVTVVGHSYTAGGTQWWNYLKGIESPEQVLLPYPAMISSGNMTFKGSWIGDELSGIDKQIAAVVVTIERTPQLNTPVITVSLEFDRPQGDPYYYLPLVVGTVPQGLRGQLRIPVCVPAMAVKTVGSWDGINNRITFGTGTSADMAIGQFVSIGGSLVAQVDNTYGAAFDLTLPPLITPQPGDLIIASLPVARRFRVALSAAASGTFYQSPIKRVTVEYQDRVTEKYRMTLQVKVQNGMTTRGGGAYPLNAGTLRDALDVWSKRQTPFEVVDPTGRVLYMKVQSFNESRVQRQEKDREPKSTAILTLMEV